MTPKCYQKVCKNDTFSRVTLNMTNCDRTAQAAADGGSGDPENHEKEQKKQPASQHSPHTTNVQKWSTTITPLGLGNHFCIHFGPWGSEQPKRCPQSRPGTPLVFQMVTQRCQKGSKMEPQSEPKFENSINNYI